jgi:hypothetical protein
MTRSVQILMFVVIDFSFAYAQDFRPGFIIKSNGDSLAGLVDNRSNKMNSRTCYFKPSRKSQKIKYLPNELKGYGLIDYKYYEAKNIPITKNQREYVFVEVLLKGKASLYRYGEIFYMEKDSLFILPKESIKEVVINDTRYFKRDRMYANILNYLLKDCNLNADKIKYEQRSLVNLFQNYNRCTGAPGFVYKTQKRWTKIDTRVFTGIDQASIRLNGFDDYTFRKSVSVPFGVGFDFSSPRLSDKSSFVLEAWYSKTLFQGYSEVVDEFTTIRNDLILNTTFLKVPCGFRYNFSHDSFTPYIKAGFVLSFPLNASGRIVSETELSGVVTTERYDAVFAKKEQTGIWASAGCIRRINQFLSGFLEVRFEENNGFVNPSAYHSSHGKNLSFLIGIKFK